MILKMKKFVETVEATFRSNEFRSDFFFQIASKKYRFIFERNVKALS